MGSFQDYINYELSYSFDELKSIFNDSIQNDGVRQRAYLKLELFLSRKINKVQLCENQEYFQSSKFNELDGGVIRKFSQINACVLSNRVFQRILEKNISIIESSGIFQNSSRITVGVHFIKYEAEECLASYSSPTWLHLDDEPLVFVHLIEISDNAIGGDNIIAQKINKKITNVIRLEKTMDTLCLTQDVYHAVTPLGSKVGRAHRSVILFTVEPRETQFGLAS